MADKFIISRHQEGISLNPLEFVLTDDDDVKEFNSLDDAKEFAKEFGATEEDFGYSIFIGTKENHDMYTGGE
jgi:hypothetical protein